MILTLLKRDVAWKIGLGHALVLAVGLPLLARGDPDPGETRLFFLCTWLAMSGFMCGHGRATPFEASLPIDGRVLVRSRVLSRLGMVWLPVVAATTVAVFAGASAPHVLCLLGAGAVYTVAYLLPLSLRLRESAPRSSDMLAAWAALALAAALAWRSLAPGPFLLAFALPGGLLLVGTWFGAPAGFQLAPIEAVGSPARSMAAPRVPSISWWPIVRSMGIRVPLPLLVAGVTCGAFGAGAWMLVPVALIGTSGLVRQRTGWLCALPLSFRARGLITLVPVIAIVFGGIAIGACFARPLWGGLGLELVLGPPSHARTDMNLDVALEFWHRAPGGESPVIRAPWGETARSATIRVAGITLFNPYSVAPTSTDRFVEWQFARATEAVYGKAIDLRHYNAAVARSLVPVTEQPRMQLLSLCGVLLELVLFMSVIELTHWRRLPLRLVPHREALAFVAPVLVVWATIALMWAYGFAVARAVIPSVLLRLSDVLPANPFLVLAVAACPIAGMYWVVEKQVSQSEQVGPIRRASGWGQGLRVE